MDTTPEVSHAQPADAAPQTDLLTGSSGVPAPVSTDEPKPLSKSALKKAAKAERFAAYKQERRAREKEAKKEKKRVRAEKRAAGELDDDEDGKRQKKKPRIQFGGKVVLDLGFDDMMNEKEISSLCSQLAYTYSANRQASFPFSLLYTSLNGRTFTRLESMNDAGYKRWANTDWWHEGYDRLWLGEAGAAGGPTTDTDAEPTASSSKTEDALLHESTLADSGETAEPGNDVQQSVVYLTADSEDELTELKPDETYIIGGICDHNRYKNLCLNKAKESDIRTARLPIGRYLASLPTRKVLTVNQVFEVLLKWVETRDWEQALYSVIPKRKFHPGGKDAMGGSHDGTPAGDADDETPREEAKESATEVISVEEIEQAEPVDEGR